MDVSFLDPLELIKTGGILMVAAIVFSESGLLVGFFLPGDSLLFTAGFLASQGFLDLLSLIVLTTLAAILGDSTGYALGKKVGLAIFSRTNSLFFNKKNIERTHSFFEKHGRKTIILARFLPIIRTFAPFLAGVGKMHYPTFLSYNIIGGIAWGVSLPTLGYVLGKTIPDVDAYLLPIILGIIAVSFLPTLFHFFQNKKSDHSPLKRRI